MTRLEFKVFVEEMNDIYFSHDWVPEGRVTATVFQEENEMPESLKYRLDNLIGELSA
jgi:hypothetical protein